MLKDKTKVIYYVVDNKGWVQYRRYLYLTKYLDSYRFRLLTVNMFKFLWILGFLKKKPIVFSLWRIVHALIKENPTIFTDSDLGYFMALVNSHSNIGGGLDPRNPIPGREPEEAFNLAVGLLKKFKVVSANSMILYELLNSSLPNLTYCPNGVDADFFTPNDKKEYDPARIKIGWVGKVRGPKNFPVIKEACKKLESIGGFKAEIVKVPKNFRKAPLSFSQMRDFYRNIDFYLTASWSEGTPNPALEAGSCGVPIVTTRVGNMRELIKDDQNGFFIEPTIESIIGRFKSIKKMDRKDYLKMSKNIRSSIVKDWSWDIQSIQIRNFKEAFTRLLSLDPRGLDYRR